MPLATSEVGGEQLAQLLERINETRLAGIPMSYHRFEGWRKGSAEDCIKSLVKKHESLELMMI